jgi:Zn-dependent protease with chaperone function
VPGLGPLLAAILLVLLGWGPGEVEAGSVTGALAFVAGAIAVTFLLGAALRRRARARPLSVPVSGLFRLSPLVFHALAIHVFGWLRVAVALGVGDLASLGVLVALLPFLLLQGIVWATSWGQMPAAAVPLRAVLGFHYRAVALALVPFLAYSGAFDALGRWRLAAVFLETWELGAWLAALLLFVGLGLAFPFLARWIWKTSPLPPGALRDSLEGIARRLGFRGREILVWKTGGLSANAAVVGLLPAARYVVLTDALLRLLSAREVEAVFGHEVGHARCRHAASLFLYAGAWVLVAVGAARLLPELPLVGEALVVLVGLLAMWTGFGYLARRFELEADLFGAAAVGDAEVFAQALERVGGASGRSRWHGSWRHFSVAKRVAFLRRVAGDPELGQRFRSRLRRLVRAAAAVAIAAGALQLVEFTARTPGEIGLVALRLGRFEDARSWLSRAAPAEEGSRVFLDLANLCASLDPGSSTLPLLREAIEILVREDREGLRRFLEGEGLPLLADEEVGSPLRELSGG